MENLRYGGGGIPRHDVLAGAPTTWWRGTLNAGFLIENLKFGVLCLF
jgi:hypothetical protein